VFTIKAALITNHPEAGLRAQPYTIAPNLESVAIQFSLILGHKVEKARLRWMVHGNVLFVSYPDARRASFHFIGCSHHQFSFRGPTLMFYCPMQKQEVAERLSIAGSWAHIVDDLIMPNTNYLAELFAPGLGDTELEPASRPLRSIDGSDQHERPSGAGGREAAGENPDDLTAMFEQLSAIGLNVHLIEHEGDVIGLAAQIGGAPPRAGKDGLNELPEKVLADDPGFYGDKPRKGHSVSLTIVSEVAFDPLHFPSPAGFVYALLAGYARMLHLNVAADCVEPEYGMAYLDMVSQIVKAAAAITDAEPSLNKLESPMLAKLPDEPGGVPRHD